MSSTASLAVARITPGTRPELSPDLEAWLVCAPSFTKLSDLPAPWRHHIRDPVDVQTTHRSDRELVLTLPLVPSQVDAFVHWHLKTGHTLELSLATDGDLGRARALRRMLLDHFLDLAPPVGSARSLIERLRVAERHVPSDKPWPQTHLKAWAERFAAHIERTFPAITAATLEPEHLLGFDALRVIEHELTSAQREQLDREVPAAIDVAGATRQVTYPVSHRGQFELPILESQGMSHTPAYAVPLEARLTAPNGRCLAVTTEIAHFWSVMYNTWFRNTLAAEFPNVDWPPVAARR